MKKTCKRIRAMVAFVLCCAMLTGAALAAEGSRVVIIDGVRIVFGATLPDAGTHANARARTFVNASYDKYNFFTGQCEPSQGDFLEMTVENTGDTPIDIKLTVYMSDEKVVETRTIRPGSPSFTATVTGPNGRGLDTRFLLEVEPTGSGSNPYYHVFCQQRTSY